MKPYHVVGYVAERKLTLKTIVWALSTFKREIVNTKSTRRLLRNCNVAWRGNTSPWGWWTHASWWGKSFWDAQVVWTVLLCVDAIHDKTVQASTSVFETPPCKIFFSSFLNITKHVPQPHQIFPSCSFFFCTSFSVFLSITSFGLRAIHTIYYSTHQHKDVHNSHDEPSLSEGGLASPFYIANSLFSEENKTM